jgi:hypothetical protein
LGSLPTGTFAVPFANVVPFSRGLMTGGRIYFELATLCEQARVPLEGCGRPRPRVERGVGDG